MNNEIGSGVTVTIDLDPAHMPKAEDPVTTLRGQDVWDMVQKVAHEYSSDDLMDAFGEEELYDALTEGDLAWFYNKFKKYEADQAVIHVGDEVAWTFPYTRYYPILHPNAARVRQCTGVVVDIQLLHHGSDTFVDGYHVLTTDEAGVEGGYRTTYIPTFKIEDYNFHKTGHKVRKLMEDDNGAKDS